MIFMLSLTEARLLQPCSSKLRLRLSGHKLELEQKLGIWADNNLDPDLIQRYPTLAYD